MPSVSVIIPVYNVEQFIERSARSLFAQTLSDIEFIFIDDCTPDHSMEVLQDVLKDYPEREAQTVLYKMPHNSGQAKVRLQGIMMATGDYVVHCDSDDYVEHDAYRMLYENAVEGGHDIVTCNFYKERSDRKVLFRSDAESIDDLLSGRSQWPLWCRMIKRSLLQEDIIPPAANVGEDMCFTLQASLKARSIGHVDVPLYHYCYNEDSITRVPGFISAVNRWKAFMENASIILSLLTERYHYPSSHPSIVSLKYYCRLSLRHYVQTREGYRLWRSTYPEVDRVFLFTPGVTLEEKFWFILIHLHLYGFVKSITNHLRKRV